MFLFCSYTWWSTTVVKYVWGESFNEATEYGPAHNYNHYWYRMTYIAIATSEQHTVQYVQ